MWRSPRASSACSTAHLAALHRSSSTQSVMGGMAGAISPPRDHSPARLAAGHGLQQSNGSKRSTDHHPCGKQR